MLKGGVLAETETRLLTEDLAVGVREWQLLEP